MIKLWLRAESKRNEKRTALTPSAVRQLLATGKFQVTVERCEQRIFKDSEYENVTFVDAQSWPSAPPDAFIVGLKELPESYTEPIKHRHIFFAHAFKGQSGWRELLHRFVQGGGSILDLEFLLDENKRRVAAFGYWAGFAGAAVGVLVWLKRQSGQNVGKIDFYPNEGALVNDVKIQLKTQAKSPSIIVIGALGRCGSGACDFASKVGLDVTRWDMAETSRGGPFHEITEHAIFINCIYLSTRIPPFLTLKSIRDGAKNLQVVVDVSCDPNNALNPVPIYSDASTFDDPCISVQDDKGQLGVDVVAIDHLPTLLPREASESFSQQLLPSLIQLSEGVRADGEYEARVWREAESLFKKKCQEATHKL